MHNNNCRPNASKTRLTYPPSSSSSSSSVTDDDKMRDKRGVGIGIGSAVLHEIFSGGSNAKMRRNVRTLLPAASALIALALCLPVMLVLDFESDGGVESRRMRRIKRKKSMTNIDGGGGGGLLSSSKSKSSSAAAAVDALYEAPVREATPVVVREAVVVREEDDGDAVQGGVPDNEEDDGEDDGEDDEMEDEDDDQQPRPSQWLGWGIFGALAGGGAAKQSGVINGGEEDARESPSKFRLPDEIDEPLATLFGHRDPMAPLPPYSLGDVVRTVQNFHDNIAVLVYDPPKDVFVMRYSENMRWTSGCRKLVTSLQMLANSLRLMFPERFVPDAPELAMSVSSGDYPALRVYGDRHPKAHPGGSLSPVLTFGSVFRVPVLPTTFIPMPMPQWNHLHCFHYWTLHEVVCPYYLPRGPENPEGLILGGESLGLAYDDLIPQVVWRGTDFSYLSRFLPDLRRPDFDKDVAGRVGEGQEGDRVGAATRALAVKALRGVYDQLIPRWKGVVWTAEAERDAERTNNALERKARTIKLRREQQRLKGEMVLPWCNIKFARTVHTGENEAATEVEYYRRFAEYGIPAAGESMSLETLGTYKYHIDLGGGGGTTWSGTLEKLGLPGLLFHHVTPTEDYLHELLVPWVHYVPVEADLSDLREKYEWAEAHPRLARRISEAATALAASLGTPEGFEAMHRIFYAEPLKRVVEAYRPLERQRPREEGGKDGEDGDDTIGWREAGGENMMPILQCGGYYQHDCEHLVDDAQLSHLGRGVLWTRHEEGNGEVAEGNEEEVR